MITLGLNIAGLTAKGNGGGGDTDPLAGIPFVLRLQTHNGDKQVVSVIGDNDLPVTTPGQAVSKWNDQWIPNNSAIQTDPASKFIYRKPNPIKAPTLEGDGSLSLMSLPGYTSTTWTIFMLIDPYEDGGNLFVDNSDELNTIVMGSQSVRLISQSPEGEGIVDTGNTGPLPGLYTFLVDGENRVIRVNGEHKEQDTYAARETLINRFRADDGLSLSGVIALYISTSALNSEQIATTEAYLNTLK